MLKFQGLRSFALLATILVLAGCAPSAIPQTGATTIPTFTFVSPGAAPTNTSPAAATSTAAATSAATSAAATPAATTATAPATAAATAPVTVAATASATAAAGGTNQSGSSATGGDIVWTVVPEKSAANYRVREQLASLNFPSDAVGKTSQISGSVAVKPDGSIDSAASKITVDLTSLQSDRSMRDNFVGRTVLQTGQYPNAVFQPTQVTGLPSPLPQSGPVTFQVTGNLTIRDVTKPVTWNVTGNIQGGQATGQATTIFTFEDFNLNQPRVPVVLSVQDHITLEVNITLQRSGS